MNKKSLLTTIYFLVTLILAGILTNFVGAQGLYDPMRGKTLPGLAGLIINWLLTIAVPLMAIMTIWAGILLMTTMGDPRKIKEAQNALTWAVAGLVLIIVLQGLFKFGQTTIAGATGLADLLNKIQQYLLIIGGPLAIVMFLYGSFLIGTAIPDNIKKGKNILIWTAVALAIISVFTVANLINIINKLAK